MSCSKIVRTKLNEIVQNIRKMDKDTNECNEIVFEFKNILPPFNIDLSHN